MYMYVSLYACMHLRMQRQHWTREAILWTGSTISVCVVRMWVCIYAGMCMYTCVCAVFVCLFVCLIICLFVCWMVARVV